MSSRWENHTWDNKAIFDFIPDAKKMIRPANFPAGTPGQGIVYVKVNAIELAVINLQARSFMVDLDDPFRVGDQLIAEAQKTNTLYFCRFSWRND
jgi:calcineurin-like phosphoesterase